MIDFALLLFKDQKSGEPKDKGFFKNILISAFNLFRKKEFDMDFKKVDLYDQRGMYFIQLPFSIGEVAGMSERQLNALEGAILSFCRQHGPVYCFYPKKADINFRNEVFIQSYYSGAILYKSLLRKVIEFVYGEKAMFLSDSDIVVISGNSLSETETILEMLSPSVKYLTVVVLQDMDIYSALERIYEETGLAIAVSGDLATAIKHADIIINLGDTRLNKRMARMKRGALLVNYGSMDGIGFTGNNAVINGLQFDLSGIIADKNLSKDVFQFYTGSELAEMIILLAMGFMDGGLPEFPDKALFLKTEEEFVKSGIKITGFKGLYSRIKREDLLQLLNIS